MAKSTAKPAFLALSELWKDTEPRQGSPSLPDGDYQAKIISLVKATTKTGKPQLDWTFEILTGDLEGRKLHKFDMMATEENVAWVKGSFATLELEIPDELETEAEFDEILEAAVGKVASITIKATGDFTNVYINELLATEEEEQKETDKGKSKGKK